MGCVITFATQWQIENIQSK